MVGRRILLVSALLAVVVVAGFVSYQVFYPQGCSTPGSSTPAKYQAAKVQFGAVTEFCLAAPSRWTNAIVAAPDGSVWFGEQALPGIGHLYPNGTVVEHPWPHANGTPGKINGSKTSTWGIALWRGMVWGSSVAGNSIVGYNPLNGSFKVIVLPHQELFPYTLTAGPDGALWFTALTQNATIGRVSPEYAVSLYSVLELREQIPVEIRFVNSSLGYYVALDPFNSAKSGLYSFDPQEAAGGVTAFRVGGNFTLLYANSLALASDTVWVAQHLVSSVAGYSLLAHDWTLYPTSTENFTNTALPYFIRSSGGTVWFNEHYANRIAALDPANGTLTEYSEANPPVTDESSIQNDLTIDATSAGLWFTSTTGNYIGFVDGSYRPPFSVSVSGINSMTLMPGATGNVGFQVAGSWRGSLKVQVSDSENYTAIPNLITVKPDRATVPAGSGPVALNVQVGAKANLHPGHYTVALTVTDGLVYQTAYLFVNVG